MHKYQKYKKYLRYHKCQKYHTYQLLLPLILRYQLEVRENKMTEFVKGKVFTIAEVRENKDGQILAKVVSSTTPKFTGLSSFIESFIKFYQVVKFYCVACTG